MGSLLLGPGTEYGHFSRTHGDGPWSLAFNQGQDSVGEYRLVDSQDSVEKKICQS